MSVNVEITAKTSELPVSVGGSAQGPVSIELTLGVEADSDGAGIVRALRHASDVAAARLGCLDANTLPPGIKRVLEQMAEAQATGVSGASVRRWAEELAAEFGWKLHEEQDR